MCDTCQGWRYTTRVKMAYVIGRMAHYGLPVYTGNVMKSYPAASLEDVQPFPCPDCSAWKKLQKPRPSHGFRDGMRPPPPHPYT